MSSKHNFYIDGNFNLDSQDLDIDTAFSSVYSTDSTAYVNIQLDEEVQKKVNYVAYDEVIDFYNKHEDSFKAFELETGVNIWFLEHFRLYFSYRNFFLKLSCISKFLSANPEGRIISDDLRIKDFIDSQDISFKSGIKTKTVEKKRVIQEFWHIVSQLKTSLPKPTDKVILSKLTDNVNGKDRRFGKLENECTKVWFRELFHFDNPLPKKQTLGSELMNSDQIMAAYLFSLAWIIDLDKFRKSLNRLQKKISGDLDISGKKDQIIFDLFWKSRSAFFIYYAEHKAFERFFRRSKISGILQSDENSPQQKAVQYAASKLGIKVFAFQHGTIHDLHPAYIYGRYKSKPSLPSKTFTWGTHFTRMLCQQGGYPEDQVSTIGRITPLNESAHINPALKSDKRVVVYATQPQRDPNIRKQQVIDVMQAAKQLTNKILLVLRPHPREKDDRYFQDIADEIKFNDFIIDRESDLKGHFEACDMLITSFSTVGAEFVPYNKPMLIIDYLNQDLIGYIREGVGIPIRQASDLVKVMGDDELAIDHEAYARFVDNYFYRNDGQAADRAIQVIEESIKGQ